MLGFILGISITVNIVLVIAIIIYLNTKNKMSKLMNFDFIDDKKDLNDFIENKKEFNDFYNNDNLDFSKLLGK